MPILTMKLSSDYFRLEIHFGQTQNTSVTRPDTYDVFREICSVPSLTFKDF